jgi:glycosyltransferase involved in cell wall biosynthesis
MNSPNPLLGVAIPTYKRPDQLRRCVHSVIASARRHDVSIWLLDDSGDDSNLPVFAELQSAYPHVVVVRNEKNLGIDRNILKSVDVCDCEYVWLLGEDDRMKPEGIARVLEVLAHTRPPFVYVNYSATDDAISFLIKERSLPLQQDQSVPAEDFYRSYAWSMGFIGACVIRRDTWLPVCPEPYLDSFFAHVGRIMEAIRGSEVHMIAEPLILNRCGTPDAFTWSSEAAVVLTGWGRMTQALNHIYSEDAGRASLAAFRRAHGMGTLKFLAYLRADKVYDCQMYASLVKPDKPSAPFRLAAWAIALAPAWPWRVLRSLLMSLRRLRSPRLLDPEPTA